MLIAVFIVFIIAAIFGIALLTHVLKNKKPSKLVALIHGILVGCGLVLLIIYCFMHSPESPLASLIFFIVAAVGGFILLSFHLHKKRIPKWLAVLHPIVALLGLLFLIIFVVLNYTI